MRKGIIFLLVFLVVISGVLAQTTLKEMRNGQGYETNDDNDAFYYKYDLSVELKEGWNLVSTFTGTDQILTTSEVKKENIKSIYYYAPLQKEYVNWLSITEGKTQIPTWWDTQDADIANGGSMWVYSNKEGTLKYWADAYEQRRILVNGWNFVGLTEEIGQIQSEGMYTFPVNFEESGCSISKVYMFDTKKNSWENVPQFETGANAIGEEYMGIGLAIKIQTNNELCIWNPTKENGLEIPTLPN